ncbi:MAG: NADH-quinone oxidoreductase subunit N [Acidobacteria bacterium]|nr:MAG: NADH-quinone oxidoreductase subunit N [Acidobacteriota bacterium]
MTLDLSLTRDLLTALLPELMLTGWALVLLVVVAWRHRTGGDLRVAGGIALAAFATTAAVVWWLWWNSAAAQGYAPMIAVDDFRFISDWLFLGTGALTVLLSMRYLEREALLAPEYYVLLLFSVLGMMLMGGGSDLMVVFLGLELMSVSVYVLAGINRKSPKAAEAALKYFLLGAFASAFLLYGIALVYGATGTTNLALIGAQVTSLHLEHGTLLLIGLALLLVGFAFKVAAVPFHMWAPDVYDGAPTPVTGFMATAVKAAAFAALFRVLGQAFATTVAWHQIVSALAVATMVSGNLVALAQRSLKRMLAYSSIAHAGYVLIGIVAGTSRGITATLVYLFIYAFMQLGAFAVIVGLRRADVAGEELKDFGGLHARNPFAAFAMLLFMLSLGGIPPTAGFMGKFWLFSAAIDAHYNWLAVIGVLNSAVSLYYYVRIVVFMYVKKEALGSEPATSPTLAVVLGVAVAATLVLGVYPRLLFELADASARTLGAAGVTTSLR